MQIANMSRVNRIRRSLRFERLNDRVMLYAAVLQAEGESDISAEQVADFALVDENPTSATHQTAVSPRDYLGQVTGWYFGHAT